MALAEVAPMDTDYTSVYHQIDKIRDDLARLPEGARVPLYLCARLQTGPDGGPQRCFRIMDTMRPGARRIGDLWDRDTKSAVLHAAVFATLDRMRPG
jgi:hypothetical protein